MKALALAAVLALAAQIALAQGVGIGMGPGPGLTVVGTFPVVAAVNTGTDVSIATSATVQLPSGIVSGNLLLIIGGFGTTCNTPLATGWTGVASGRMCYWYRQADGSEGATVSVSWTNSSNMRFRTFRISGNASGVAPEFSTTVTGTSANPDAGNLTPSWGAKNTLWINAARWSTTGTVTSYASGMTDNQYSSVLDTPRLGVATQNLNAASNNTGAWTLTDASAVWWINTIAVSP